MHNFAFFALSLPLFKKILRLKFHENLWEGNAQQINEDCVYREHD